MAHKKNGFLNFCFSLVPGAGQMYQGFIKRGASIMTLFFGWLCVSAYMGVDEILFFLPVIWFFGFFDALHRNSLSDAEREQLKDGFLWVHEEEFDKMTLRKFRIPAAVVLIFIGAYELLRMFVYMLIGRGILFWDSTIVGLVYDEFPKMVFSFVIIMVGVYLISGKKKQMDNMEQGAASGMPKAEFDKQNFDFGKKEEIVEENLPTDEQREDESGNLEEEDGGEKV